MSLKAFHIFFIATSVLLAVGLGVMSLRVYLAHNAAASLGWSLLSFAAALVLVLYGRHILRKLRNVGYL